MAVGQNQWYHFGVGAPPILVNFSGDWDVHCGYHGPLGGVPFSWIPFFGWLRKATNHFPGSSWGHTPFLWIRFPVLDMGASWQAFGDQMCCSLQLDVMLFSGLDQFANYQT